MLLRLLLTSLILLKLIVAQTTLANNSSKGQATLAPILPKQASLYDDYDLNEAKSSGTRVEGSGGAASLDEYADDEEEDQLSKVTATATTTTTKISPTRSSSATTTIVTTTTTTTTSTTTAPSTTTMVRRTSTATTTSSASNRWMKTTNQADLPKKKNVSSIPSPPVNDADTNEFKDDQEEYGDDLEDDAYYNEPTLSNKIPATPGFTTRYPTPPTRPPSSINHATPIWMLFSFLTRPPIAAGILAGLAIGIFTSIILLICIIRRYHRREKSHSSYTTGLLYPNHYGYSKSPQEFYA